jgi:hypothetical protein
VRFLALRVIDNVMGLDLHSWYEAV